MPAVKKKPVAKTAAKGKGDWFHKKSPAAQKAYIAKHPTSIYAKQAKKAGADKVQTKAKEAAPAVDEKTAAAAEKKALKRVLASREKEPKLKANIKDNSPEKIKEHDDWNKKHRAAERAHDELVRARKQRELAKSKADWEAKKKSAGPSKRRTPAPAAKKQVSARLGKAAGPKKSPELKKLEAAHKALERTGPKGIPKTPAERAAYVKWREKIAKSAAAIRKATPEKRKKLTRR